MDKLSTIDIMNLRKDEPIEAYDVVIDRRNPLGNIFFMKNELWRDRVCDKYDEWFKKTVLLSKQAASWRELQRLQTLYMTHRKLRLFCWCAPERCHGVTIKRWLEDTTYD